MPREDAVYQPIIAHYEGCLARHGDSHRGVDWPRADEAQRRYSVMLELIPEGGPRPCRLLDFGCGAAHLLEHIRSNRISGLEYLGLDVSEQFVALCRSKFPGVPFLCADVLEDQIDLPPVDYVVMNGVFTEKRELSHDQMWRYAQVVLRRVWPFASRGLAFNVMSRHVEWERDDLFHMPCDALLAFLTATLSRHCVIRHDYGLFEYTAYVYREPPRWRT
jgi:SAM-dependent methyltransferase